jgi:hypothetical protein
MCRVPRSRTAALGVALLTVALATRGRADEGAALRAAVAGLSPDFCPTLRALVDAAANGFAALRGAPQVDGENVWAGTRRLPGGGECLVFGGRPPSYVCTLYAGDVEENADGAYDRAVSGLRDCLPAGWKTTEKVDALHTRTSTASAGAGPAVRVVSRGAGADAYQVELWVDAARP